ncbi:hypothetical protein LCGC14_2362820, partial [marine sediment metagenome]
MDSSEEDIPKIKIHLKTHWYLILLLSLTIMIIWVFPPSFFRNHEFWFDIFMGSLVTITFIIGLLCKNVELIFKIDNADNILI